MTGRSSEQPVALDVTGPVEVDDEVFAPIVSLKTHQMYASGSNGIFSRNRVVILVTNSMGLLILPSHPITLVLPAPVPVHGHVHVHVPLMPLLIQYTPQIETYGQLNVQCDKFPCSPWSKISCIP